MMSNWNSDLYLKFKQQRTQPALDLVNRIRTLTPHKIVDLGCGPGNSTAVLGSAFPNAQIIGIDNSQNMIDKAKAEHPELSFKLCDAHGLEGGYDLIFSNACLQWIPDHKELLPELMGKLNDGGTLAVQIPCNGNEPLYRIVSEVVADPKWGFQNTPSETNDVLSPEEYFNILSACSAAFDIWETVYYHALPSHQALIDWIKGTRLRPYLNALNEEQAALFEKEILDRAADAYAMMENGTVVLKFRRLFFAAIK